MTVKSMIRCVYGLIVIMSLWLLIVFLHDVIGMNGRDIFYGIEREFYVRIPFPWGWIYFPLWFAAGYQINKMLKERVLTVFRYGQWYRWYKALLIDMLMLVMAYGLGLAAAYRAMGVAGDYLPVVLIVVHGSLMTAILLWLRLLMDSDVLPMIGVFLIEIFAFLTGDERGISAAYISSDWGMYCRSGAVASEETLAMAFDITTVCILQAAGIVFLVWSGYWVMKRGRIKWQINA